MHFPRAFVLRSVCLPRLRFFRFDQPDSPFPPLSSPSSRLCLGAFAAVRSLTLHHEPRPAASLALGSLESLGAAWRVAGGDPRNEELECGGQPLRGLRGLRNGDPSAWRLASGDSGMKLSFVGHQNELPHFFFFLGAFW